MTDLVAIREQREWERNTSDERASVAPHFRNCYTGCGWYDMVQAMEGLGDLRPFCEACELRPGPCKEAESVMLLWTLPDSVLKIETRPYWLVAGVSFARTLYQSRGF